ncbi:hypothetical protein [Chryseobacterium sp. EO14]|uniref:hypothetical protein n=1 Tax=Chryseobacterium sp. EO14 TaxID=2950551 RepID=UPI00210E81F2|nr:hypothetical protein [Chryseobacterium sp. EO14]MCQ4142719.1 hypothetical protein [Chryseobacterium sp. EO14]
MSSKKFHFVKYEFGAVKAENGKEASMLIANPFIPKESQVLVLVSQNVGTPVFPNLEHQEIIERISNLETAIIWKESDFEFQAKKLEAAEGETLFDRKKFIPALYEMIKKHNPVEGISISTIEKYLHAFCKMGS